MVKVRSGVGILGIFFLITSLAFGQQTPSGLTVGSGKTPVIAPSPVVAPRLINFGGRIKSNDAGQPATGVIGVTFAIYATQEGGVPLWLETQNVQLDPQGNYAALLGATTNQGMPIDLFSSGESRWLGVQAQLTGAEEQPRVLMVSVPYALKAVDADTLGGQPLSAFVLNDSLNRGSSPKAETNITSVDNPTVSALTGAGTAGTVPKFDQTGTNLIDSGISETNGNISLGSSSSSVLTVKGPSLLTNDLDLTRRFDNFPQASVVVDNTITTSFAFQKLGGGNINNISFLANNLYASGNLGIGTQTPGARLTVNGVSQLTNDLDLTRRFDNFAEASLVVDNSITKGFVFQKLGGGNIDNIKFLGSTLYASGNLGIGTQTPTQKLEVAGTAKVNSVMFGDNTTQTTASNLTGITAGAGLTGGGTAGSVGLAMSDAARTRVITYLAGCDTCGVLTDSDSQNMIYLNLIGTMSIVSVTCYTDAGNITINIARNSSNIITGNLICSPTGASVSTGLGTVNLNDVLDFKMISAGNSTKRATVIIKTTM